jgi:hypothetical protein
MTMVYHSPVVAVVVDDLEERKKRPSIVFPFDLLWWPGSGPWAEDEMTGINVVSLHTTEPPAPTDLFLYDPIPNTIDDLIPDIDEIPIMFIVPEPHEFPRLQSFVPGTFDDPFIVLISRRFPPTETSHASPGQSGVQQRFKRPHRELTLPIPHR